jgi:ribosome recycling factor
MSEQDILDDADLRMELAVEKVGEDFGAIRTGRANPKLLNKVHVDYYGTRTPLYQLANFSVPEPRLLVVNPFDKSSVGDVEKAIRESGLGLNPANDGQVIRCVFPELTEERRREFIRLAREAAEDGRIAVRNIRRAARDDLHGLERDGEISQDEQHRAEEQLDAMTSRHVDAIDSLLDKKEADLLEV